MSRFSWCSCFTRMCTRISHKAPSGGHGGEAGGRGRGRMVYGHQGTALGPCTPLPCLPHPPCCLPFSSPLLPPPPPMPPVPPGHLQFGHRGGDGLQLVHDLPRGASTSHGPSHPPTQPSLGPVRVPSYPMQPIPMVPHGAPLAPLCMACPTQASRRMDPSSSRHSCRGHAMGGACHGRGMPWRRHAIIPAVLPHTHTLGSPVPLPPRTPYSRPHSAPTAPWAPARGPLRLSPAPSDPPRHDPSAPT